MYTVILKVILTKKKKRERDHRLNPDPSDCLSLFLPHELNVVCAEPVCSSVIKKKKKKAI